ncbi:hypothetical protein DXG01_014939 [Tephrocybe rancida]|nr:hypothetical protein DXG01_014939 [Tephrocybe rancida]
MPIYLILAPKIPFNLIVILMFFVDPVNGHIPDVSSFEDVIDLFCFCHFFELQGVLCSWQYTLDSSMPAVQARQRVIKGWKLARQIKNWFFCRYNLKLEGVPLSFHDTQELLDHQFLAQQCKALLTFKERVEADPNAKYLVGEFVVKQGDLNTPLVECLKGNTSALAHFKSPQTTLTFNWTHGLQYSIHEKPLPLPLDSAIEGLTYNNKQFFQTQKTHRARVKASWTRSVTIPTVEPLVETVVLSTVKRKWAVHSDGPSGDVKHAQARSSEAGRCKHDITIKLSATASANAYGFARQTT